MCAVVGWTPGLVPGAGDVFTTDCADTGFAVGFAGPFVAPAGALTGVLAALTVTGFFGGGVVAAEAKLKLRRADAQYMFRTELYYKPKLYAQERLV
jgi:hypothetical protein